MLLNSLTKKHNPIHFYYSDYKKSAFPLMRIYEILFARDDCVEDVNYVGLMKVSIKCNHFKNIKQRIYNC